MHALATWEQSPTFDPYNPNQIIREAYTAIPGGYGSFYFNKVPTDSKLQGLGTATGFASLSPMVQAVIVTGLAAVIGFYGWKHVGPMLKKPSGGVSGHRRRR